MLFSFKKKQEQFIKKKTRLGRRRTSAVGRVPTDNNFIITIMTTIKAIVNGVQVSNINGVISISITTNATFDGFIRNVDRNTGVIDYTRGMVSNVRFTMSQFVHFVNAIAPMHAYYFAGINPFELSQKDARDLLLGATITFTRNFQPAGTEYVDENGERKTTKGDRFDTQILSIEPCDLNNAIIFDMERTPAMVMAAINAAKTVQPVITDDTATEPTDDEAAEAE